MSRALTKAEQKLLRYPPTETTWMCRRRINAYDRCNAANAGSQKDCWLCHAPKTSRPTLLWPKYVAACKKAGIEPGERWPSKPTASPEATTSRQVTRRKGR